MNCQKCKYGASCVEHKLCVSCKKINELQKPIQFLIMALEEVLKSQKESFETELHYKVYKKTMKELLLKIFESET